MRLNTAVSSVPVIGKEFEELRELRSGRGYAFLDQDLIALERYFAGAGRNPTDLEMGALDQNWSEHSAHGTFLGENTIFDYSEDPDNPRVIKFDNLLKDTIMKGASQVNAPHIEVPFSDDSGLSAVCKIVDGRKIFYKIRIGGEEHTFMYAKKGESHNHPFGIEPVGGVETCGGGVIRDTYAVLGKPISLMIFFCLADPDIPDDMVPRGRKSPWEYLLGGTRGHRSYGNPVGIPTHLARYFFSPRRIHTDIESNGKKIEFGNIARPLVMGYSFGLVDRMNYKYDPKPGDGLVLIGPPAKLVGVDGAVGSSLSHDQNTSLTRESSVQQGNPEAERKWGKLFEDVLFDSGKIRYIQDVGGGGVSSALFETPKRLATDRKGVRVYANRIPTDVDGMSYYELILNESQERMVVVSRQDDIPWILDQCRRYDVDAYHVADLTEDGRCVVLDENTGKIVMDLDYEFLSNGKPKVRRNAVYKVHDLPQPGIVIKRNQGLDNELERLLRNPNIADQSPMIRTFDHQVQGRTILPQFSGPNFDNPNDAAVISLFDGHYIAAVESCALNNRMGIKDMRKMVPYVIDEAIKRNILHGGNLETMAISDNWCMANVRSDDEDLGRLAMGSVVFGQSEIGYNVPANDGKDSMNNSFTDGNSIHYVAPHLFVASLSIAEDYRKAVSSFLKRPGNWIYIVGPTTAQMGGSIFYYDTGYIGNDLPDTDIKSNVERYRILQSVIQTGLAHDERIVRSVKSIGDGGLVVAAFNMTYENPATGRNVGMEIDLGNIPRRGNLEDWHALFNEAPGRALLEVPPEKADQFEEMMYDQPYARIGRVTEGDNITIYGPSGNRAISAGVGKLKQVWREKFRRV